LAVATKTQKITSKVDATHCSVPLRGELQRGPDKPICLLLSAAVMP